ncbi:malectin [Occallatibacter riparius]|uniref:Malectin n=1 Tax=Occallatibacter riparius TaxID=1002689 RepID=A0A9J7BSI8_9BACT|nr:malectin [Occallatibacter riparius]UWZ85851.1 malectin [Occallatibacter riparius]
MQGPPSDSVSLQRAELETVLAALARNPRLAKLLRFLAERSLEGRDEEITEYAIATEVFGRSKTAFDGSTDSIARVETYRLRKRLKEYYETEGKDHPVVISLPFRSYVPEFARRVDPSLTFPPATPEVAANRQELPPSDLNTGSARPAIDLNGGADAITPLRRTPRPLIFGAASLVVLALLAFSAYELNWIRSAHPSNTTAGNPPTAASPVTPANVAQVPLRLLAGYQGSPKIDSAGAYWESDDRFYIGPVGYERPRTPVARTSDPMLFDHWRTGDFSYDIPLAPGVYELHLFFVASAPDDKAQFFDVTANGQPLLKGFNISYDALGPNVADEKVFKDISPDKDGHLHLKFTSGRAAATLSALEILPGLPHRQVPIRIVAQPTAVTDHDGNLWHPDNYFENGVLSDTPRQVSGTPDPNLYMQERFGHFTYSIPVDVRGRYTLVLHFAELYWIADRSQSIGVGTRVFSVYCNGSTLLDHFDIFKEVGSLHAVTKTFTHIRPTPEGKLDLTFDPTVNFATVSAIEVIDESE